jgi:Fic family protein
MNPDDFRSSPAGHLAPTLQGAFAFVPNPLPPQNIDKAGLITAVERANHALGELSGVGRTLPNPGLLIRPFLRIEAVASSKIEGTVTTFSELFQLELEPGEAARSDTKEVRNYSRALEHGLSRLQTLPISKRLILELHQVLMEGVAPTRGAQFRPGEFKTDQNWIGARLLQNAKFVPPPPNEAMEALDALERYINEPDDDLPLIVQLALIHYQFETIHPFPDGNGRIGRLLIPLILCERKRLSQPLLYLSTFFEKNYTEYIDSMYEVSRIGAWDPWIRFFLKGIEESCNDAIAKAHRIQDLHRLYHQRIQKARTSALLGKLIDDLFVIPAINIPYASDALGVSYNSAKKNIRQLVDFGMLRESKAAGDRTKWYFADEIMAAAHGLEAQKNLLMPQNAAMTTPQPNTAG